MAGPQRTGLPVRPEAAAGGSAVQEGQRRRVTEGEGEEMDGGEQLMATVASAEVMEADVVVDVNQNPEERARGSEEARPCLRPGSSGDGVGAGLSQQGETEQAERGDGREEEGEDGRAPQRLRTPFTVTAEEKEKHELTHTPYRAWCRHCVRARGRNEAHRSREEDKKRSGVPRIAMDYFFMSKEDDEAQKNPLIVLVDEETGEKYARAVGQKGLGAAGEMDWLVRDMSDELTAWGHPGGESGHIILKSDGEPAVVAVRDSLAKYHGGKVVQEGPPRGESASNGAVEVAGRTVREFTRVLKEQVEYSAQIELGTAEALTAWMVRWAAMLCSRFLVGKDGLTAYERRRGRPCQVPVVIFGEKVWYKEIRATKERKDKFESEWREGVWLGHRRNSNEHVIGTRSGAVRAYAIKRKDAAHRWDASLLKELRGTPQKPDPQRPGLVVPIRINFDMPAEAMPLAEGPQVRPRQARRMKITSRMLEQYGFTEGCEGCRFKQAGLEESRNHSEVCRKRVEEAIEATEEGKRAKARQDERVNSWIAERMEEADRSQQLDAPGANAQASEEMAVDATEVDAEAMQVQEEPGAGDMEGLTDSGALGVLDLSEGWDLSQTEQQQRVVSHMEAHKPALLICSPRCASTGRRWKEHPKHSQFVASLCEWQSTQHSWYLYEHPVAASRRGMDAIREVEKAGSKQYVIEGRKSSDEVVDVLPSGRCQQVGRTVRTWVTNSEEVCSCLRQRISLDQPVPTCYKLGPIWGTCGSEHQSPSTEHALSKKVGSDVCSAVQTGLLQETHWKQAGLRKLVDVGPETHMARDHVEEEEDDTTWLQAWDDVSGQELDPKEVRRARTKEMGYVAEKEVWKVIPRAEAEQRGWRIISTRWVDINKGDTEKPKYRSRLVAKEFKRGGREDMEGLFAATPPLEALRLLLSVAATGERDHVIMTNDVARAFFEAPAQRDVCIELPEEARQSHTGDVVGHLQKSLYGTRDAAANFQDEVRKVMLQSGFEQSTYSPSIYFHRKRSIRALVHGDDFISTGQRQQVAWFRMMLEARFEITTTIVGSGDNEAREARLLNRVIRVTPEGWEYEADQRHGELIVKGLGLERAKSVNSPGEDLKPWEEDENAIPLNPADATAYRALAARANYLALDRADIQFAAKEVCRGMAQPTRGHLKMLRRLGRYLIGEPRVVWKYQFQNSISELIVYSDSDWAGCRRTARSTTGGAAVRGAHCLRTWSSTQKFVTLSSAEAELMAAVRAASEAIGLTQLAQSWGLDLSARVFVDSSAALGVVSRKGNGKLRHVRVGNLWVQELAARREVDFVKVRGTENPADLCTKYLTATVLRKLLAHLSQESRGGRAAESLQCT